MGSTAVRPSSFHSSCGPEDTMGSYITELLRSSPMHQTLAGCTVTYHEQHLHTTCNFRLPGNWRRWKAGPGATWGRLLNVRCPITPRYVLPVRRNAAPAPPYWVWRQCRSFPPATLNRAGPAVQTKCAK